MEEYGRLGWYGRERGKGNALGAGKDDGGLWRGLEMWWYHIISRWIPVVVGGYSSSYCAGSRSAGYGIIVLLVCLTAQ